MRRLLALALLVWPLAAPAQEAAQDAAPAPEAALADVVIGLVTLRDDPRYVRDWGYARLVVPPPVRSIDGAAMAIEDLAFVSEAMGLAPRMATREVAGDGTAEGAADGTAAGAAEAAVEELAGEGALFVLLDLPGDLVEAVAAAEPDVTLINVSAPENALRQACHAGLLHTYPSDRQLMDAFAQMLRSKDWTDVLILEGGSPRDAAIADAFTESAERLRLTIRDRRAFTLAADPSQREGNNVALLTGGVRYDVVFVADARGEFGRFVPYATQEARPVIGSVGLTAEAWHWAMERDGATQVSSRFDRLYGRRMGSVDWASWIAVKAVLQAYTRAPEQSRAAMTAYMASDAMALDGSKGVQLNFRPWSGQLRMPVLLATADAVIAVAPLEGYLHATNVLDTLGEDQSEIACP
jgi:ABC transporter substrate binding protein (PQQ-dependent alcohol dehydrogenase system)